MTTLFLTLHLSGAIGLAGMVIALIAVLWRKAAADSVYLRFAKVIAALSSWQFASGLLLAVFNPGMSVLKLCSNIVIYWAIVFVAELAIMMRLQKKAVRVPNA